MIATVPWLLVAAHVLGASAFVGGQLALLPMTRALRGDRERLRAVARAAQPVLWGGLALAMLSGLGLAALRGWDALLAWKAGLAVVVAGGALAHVQNPRRGGPAWVTGVGAGVAFLGGLALVALGAAARWS